MKKSFFLFSLFLIGLLFLPTVAFGQKTLEKNKPIHAKGLVTKVETSILPADPTDYLFSHPDSIEIPETFQQQTLHIEILTGPDKGEIIPVQNDLKGNPFDLKVQKGDKVFLYGWTDGSQIQYAVQDFYHLDSLILFGIAFLILTLLLIGWRKGFKALGSLAISLLIIFAVLIPALKAGYNPLIITLPLAITITIFAILILIGFKKKALTAIIGTSVGLLTAAIFTIIAGKFLHLTGLGTEDARLLALNLPTLNFQGILFAGILIGTLGAVMDVAVSIASGLEEIKEHHPQISPQALMKSGMNIGRDIMGSMLNTLIFAYVGASLILILLASNTDTDIVELLNYGFVTEEIVRSLIGSLGLLFTIPLTALTARCLNKESKN